MRGLAAETNLALRARLCRSHKATEALVELVDRPQPAEAPEAEKSAA